MNLYVMLMTVLIAYLNCLLHVRSQTHRIVVVIDNTILEYNKNIEKILSNSDSLVDQGVNLAQTEFKIIIADKNDSLVTLDNVCAEMKKGAVALIDMSIPSSAVLLRSYASSLGIAYISVVDKSYFRYGSGDSTIHYQIEPTAVEILQIVADIVNFDDLNNVAIVYDETFDIQNTPRRILTNVPAQHLYVRMSSDPTETKRQVEMLKRIEIKNIFIIGNSRKAPDFLEVANVISDEFDVNWFFLTKDSKLTCLKCDMEVRVTMITASPQNSVKKQYDNFMQDILNGGIFGRDSFKIDEALVYDLMRMIKRGITNVTDIQPIVYNECLNTTTNETYLQQSQQLVTALKNIGLEGVYGPLVEENDITRYKFTLLINQLTFKSGNNINNREVGNWTEAGEDGRRLVLKPGITSLTKSNKKKLYRVVTVANMPPFVYKKVSGNTTNTNDMYDGYCIELLKRISYLLDFDYILYDSPDGMYGSMDDDGNWNGAIKELIDKKADIAVGPISVMAERENVVDFTVPYYDLVGLTILMKKPEFDYTLGKFLTVLDEDVWFCIIGAFFLFSILICVFDKLSPFSYQNNTVDWNGEGTEPRVFTLKEGIWFCMMSLTPQGGGETPRALSGRLVAATWWLFGFIIIATYTANLAAFLTVSRLETPIESLDDLSKQFKVKYAPMNGSNALIYFKRMQEIEHRFYGIWKNMSLDDNLGAVERAKLAVWDYPVSDKYTKLWETMLESEFPSNKDEAVERVLTGEFAYIGDATVNKYAKLTNCDLWEVGEEFSRKPYALAVQEGSPLRSQLSTIILQLINQRELEEYKTKWWKKDKRDCPDIEDESNGISIKNIGGVFLVIVIGSALALITLAIECYWYKYKPKQKKKLYVISSKANLNKLDTAPSGNNLSNLANGYQSSTQLCNGHVPEGETTSNGKIENDGHTNTGFVEMTERL